MLQAEGAVGCRRLIAAASTVVVAPAGVVLLAVAVPAAFTPLDRRDDSDAPAGAITGTRVRSIGVEAGGRRGNARVEVYAFFFFAFLDRSLEGKKEKEKNEKHLSTLFFPFSLFSLFLIYNKPHADNNDDDRAKTGGGGLAPRHPSPLPPQNRSVAPSSSSVSSAPALALAPDGLDGAHEAAAPEALAELLGLGLRDPGDDDGGAVVVGFLHDLVVFSFGKGRV